MTFVIRNNTRTCPTSWKH